MTVPLLLGDRVLGTLSVQSYEPDAYTEDDLLILQAIAVQAAVGIESLRRSAGPAAQLQRRLSEFAAILESMTDGLLVVDSDGRVIRLTRAARELLCLDDSSIILGQPLDEERWGQSSLGPPTAAEALRPMIEALRRGETVRDVQVELPGHSRRVLSFSCAPVIDTDTGPASGVIVFRDVTGIREARCTQDDLLAKVLREVMTSLSTIKEQAEPLASLAISTGTIPGAAALERTNAILQQIEHAVRLLGLFPQSRSQRDQFDHWTTYPGVYEVIPAAGTAEQVGNERDGLLAPPGEVAS